MPTRDKALSSKDLGKDAESPASPPAGGKIGMKRFQALTKAVMQVSNKAVLKEEERQRLAKASGEKKRSKKRNPPSS